MRTASGRADLARILLGLPPDRADRAAALLGFERLPERAVAPPLPVDPVAAAPPGPQPEPTETAPVPLWRLEEMTFAADATPEPISVVVEPARGLTDDDLRSTGSLFAAPSPPPLAPWSRLWPTVRAALQTTQPGRDPDVRAIVRSLGRGEILRRIPRVVRRAWSGRASLWIDRSTRLVPFWSDQADVCRRILRASGRVGVDLRVLGSREQTESISCRRDLLGDFRPDPATPVLVLGDLGFYGSLAERIAWTRTARRLRHAEVRFTALCPIPPGYLEQRLGARWSVVPWEQGKRAAAGARDPVARRQRAERLLRLASPATLVQPGLLRALRRLLPAREADAATEADAWGHAEVLAADATGLVLQPEAAERWRVQFASEPDELKGGVRRAIAAWREGLPREMLRAETLIWHALDTGVDPPGPLDDALGFASRFAETVRHGHAEPVTSAALRSYGRALLRAMPAGVYDAVPSLKLVWAAAFEGTDTKVPQGLDPRALYAALGRREAPRWWAVRHVGGALVLTPATSAWPSNTGGFGSPVAWLVAGLPHVWVTRGREGSQTQLVLGQEEEVLLLQEESVELRTDRCAVSLSRWVREPWATAAGRDEFGLWAAAEVNDVVQRFRWIPPGRFKMGSPESEAVRWEDEGPQRCVTWSRGRWIADTPVTQALWEAVMGVGNNPSRFKSPDRPVEQVSAEDCEKFIGRLNAIAPGLNARLPSEAEWEHACRAGTETATWAGDLEIRGGNDAPLLDAIAWYGGNCGVDFDLKDGADTKGWAEKQYPHEQGGTRAVATKLPNPLGMYDLLGNVMEWCLDAWHYGQGYSGPHDVVDPIAAREGPDRVSRGGSWGSYAEHVRAAYRSAGAPARSNDVSLGFRLARGQEPGPEPAAEPAPRSGPSRDAVRGPRPARDALAQEFGEDRYGYFMSFKLGQVVQRLRWVPAGTFVMGSPEREAGRWDDEGPQHEVTLTEGYWLGETPCTQALWVAVMGENPSGFRSPDRPVERVSWEDCQRFLERINDMVPELGARLPTEAEWERACRAGTTGATWVRELDPTSDGLRAPVLDAIAWYYGNSDGETQPVGKKRPNPYGIHDMLGNVFEWCADWNGRYGAAPVIDPRGPAAGSRRVVRGGSWGDVDRLVRAAYRGADEPSDRYDGVGFRLARGQGGRARGAEPRPRSGLPGAAERPPPGRGTRPGPAAPRDEAPPPRRRRPR